MLTDNNERIQQLTSEQVGIIFVHGVAEGMIVVLDRLTDYGFVVVLHDHVAVKVVARCRITVLSFREVEGACARGVR